MTEKMRVDTIRAALSTTAPFLSSLLARVRIVASTRVPTACANPREIQVNPEFWGQLTAGQKVFVLAHEVLHIAFDHPHQFRNVKNKQPLIFNLAADAVVNHLLSQMIKIQMPQDFRPVDFDTIRRFLDNPPDDLEKYSALNVYSLLIRSLQSSDSSIEVTADLSGEVGGSSSGSGATGQEEGDQNGKERQTEKKSRGEGDKEKGGDGGAGEEEEVDEGNRGKDERGKGGGEDEEVIQPGDASMPRDSDGLRRYWREAVVKAAMTAKMAGKLPAGAERFVAELTKTRVPWRVLLRQAIHNGLGRSVVSSWTRINRKHNGFPGVKRLTRPRVWCLVDTSGSIGGDELRQFLSEVYSISRGGASSVAVIPWDAKAYGEIAIRKPSDIAKASRLSGEGGTCIGPAFQRVVSRMRGSDVIVVLTDGKIFDAGESQVIRLAQRIRAKASTCIFATTCKPCEWQGWKEVKLEVT